MTIAQQPFNNIFRQPYKVIVYHPDAFSVGVIMRDESPATGEVMVSVQRVQDNKAKSLEERGIVGREIKRLFGHVFLPMQNEPIIGAKTGAPAATDFVYTGEDEQTLIADFYQPAIHGAITGAVPGQRAPTCPAARILIRGVWYEVVERVEMLNAVLSNFEYHVARLPLDEQLPT